MAVRSDRDANVSDQTQISVTERARQLYDAQGADYDRQLLRTCDYRSPARLAQLLGERRVSMCFDPPWLDLGAGTGLVGRALAEAGLDPPLIAVDLSQSLLSQIDHAPYIACARLDVLDADGLDTLPAHGAIALGLTEHLLDLNSWLAICARVLPAGAPLIFSYCPSNNAAPDTAAKYEVFESFANLIAHTPKHVSSALLSNGFDLQHEQDGPGYRTAGRDVVHCLAYATRR